MKAVLANGALIPSLGFGTYRMAGPALPRLVSAALKAGFRHVDTAQVYANEAEVGDGGIASGVPRSEVFITTKVWVSTMNRGASHFR
jgi:2,5-diketo-D-gluconate reductase B